MKKSLVALLGLFTAFTSCQVNKEIASNDSKELTFTSSISTKVVSNTFETGDEISVTALSGSSVFGSAVYTYGASNVFTSDDAIVNNDGASLSFIAAYPAQDDVTAPFNFAISGAQNDAVNYEASDLLVANTAATTALQPQLTFRHVLSQIVLNVEGVDVNASEVVFSALNTAKCDLIAGTYVGTGSAAKITPAVNGTLGYNAIIAPQTVAAGTTFATLTYQGQTYTWANTTDMTFLSRKQYVYTWKINVETGTSEVVFSGEILGWEDGDESEGGDQGGDQGGVTGETIVMDGSELPVNYEENAAITVDGASFTANQVGNFTEKFPDSKGPIQFKGGVNSSIYNNDAIEGLTELVVTLAPAGTTYNNFEIFAGTSQNPAGEAITPAKEGDVCTYALPEGTTFVSIQNNSTYTAYASEIKFVVGEGGTTNPGGGENPDGGDQGGDQGEATGSTVVFDGSELPQKAYANGETYTVDGADFTLNLVGNFTAYAGTPAPIQFKKSEGYLFNNNVIEDLKEVVIELVNDNAFTVYEGTEQNPTAVEVVPTVDGQIYTYALTEGTTFITIANLNPSVAYANEIKIVAGDGTVNPDGGTTNPDGGENPDGGDQGGDQNPDADLTDFALEIASLPTEASSEVATFEQHGLTFEYTNCLYQASYGSIQMLKEVGAYLKNNTAMTGIKQVVVEEDFKYYNLSVYASATADGLFTEIPAADFGGVYVYDVDGYDFIKVTNDSGYDAACDAIKFIFSEEGMIVPDAGQVQLTYDVLVAALGGVEVTDAGYNVESVDFDNFSLSADKGESNMTLRLWLSDKSIRTYATNTITFTAKDGKKIKSIDFSASEITAASEGAIAKTAWTGDASEVTLTMAKGTNKFINVVVE